MSMHETDQRQVVNILRQFGGVQRGNALAAAARLTEKQQRALLADYRDKVKPLYALATAALAAADKASEPAPVPAAEVNPSNEALTT